MIAQMYKMSDVITHHTGLLMSFDSEQKKQICSEIASLFTSCQWGHATAHGVGLLTEMDTIGQHLQF